LTCDWSSDVCSSDLYSVGFILVVNIVNFLFLKEELSKKDYVAMGLVCVALVFLNI